MMTMTEFEIVKSFREALNKNKQVGILSDLNNCKPEVIMEILKRNNAILGVPKQPEPTAAKPKVQRAKNTNWTPELDAEVTRLAKEGLKITEIAERLGINKQAIYDRRSALSKAVGGTKRPYNRKPKEVISTEKNTEVNNMHDIRAMAKEIKNIFDVCGYDVSCFNIDMITGTLNITAKEKTADVSASNGQGV